MSWWWVWVAVADLVLFVACWSVVTTQVAAGVPVTMALHAGYWGFALAGLALAVYGFVVLVRSGGAQITRPVLCVLLTTSPACGALIGLLSRLGTHPVG